MRGLDGDTWRAASWRRRRLKQAQALMVTGPLGRLENTLADWAESASGRGCVVALLGWAGFLAIGGATYWLVAATHATGATLFWGVVIVLVVGVALLAFVAAFASKVRKRR